MDRTSSSSLPAAIEALRQNFSIVDYGVFSTFLIVSALIGVFFGWKERKNQNNKQFLTGDRDLQTFPVVMSLAASFMSTNTILGVPAEVYTLGTQFLIGMLSFMIAVVLSAEVFLPVFYDLNMTSVNEYLFQRFKSVRVRTIGSFSFILSTVCRKSAEEQPINAARTISSRRCRTWLSSCTGPHWRSLPLLLFPLPSRS